MSTTDDYLAEVEQRAEKLANASGYTKAGAAFESAADVPRLLEFARQTLALADECAWCSDPVQQSLAGEIRAIGYHALGGEQA